MQSKADTSVPVRPELQAVTEKLSSLPALRDLNKLNAFVRVADCRSFTQAARHLRTTPSVLSKHLSELEDALGFCLLNRSTHGVALTEAGEGLYRHCLQMFATLDDYVVDTRNVEAGPYGSLRVQADAGYARAVLAPRMAAFIRGHPMLRVQLIAESLPNLLEERCDVIIAAKSPPGLGLVGCDIGAIAHVVCAAPDYVRRHGLPNEPFDLRSHNCLVNSSFAPKEWPFRSGTQTTAVDVRGTFSSNSAAVLVQVALDGVGIVRVPRYAVQAELASGRLVAILDAVTQSPERMHAYHSKTKHLPAKITAFIDYLKAALVAADVRTARQASSGE
jgi:DNA-binding transcriptional LysR family regulator